MKSRGGFTLVEMLVVIIIIVILAGGSVMLMNNIFRGQAVRQAGVIVMQGVAQAKQMAAATRKVHFLVFSVTSQEAWLEIHEDTFGNGEYNGDQNPASDDLQDKMVEGHRIDLPQFVVFDTAPAWLAFQPSGYMTQHDSSGNRISVVYTPSQFDGVMKGSNPSPLGEIVIGMQNRPYKMCLNLDFVAGKVRRQVFLAKEQ